MKKTKGTQTSAFGTNGRINHDSSKFYNSKLYKELDNQYNYKKIIDKNENELPVELVNKFILGSAEKM
jgi:site-specific DNA-methyltransferase (adenine-specific)